jgi:hypothetical protein
MRIVLLLATVGLTAAGLAACGSGPAPGVPSLGGTATAAATGSAACVSWTDGAKGSGYRPTCAGGTGDARRNALHAAAECIRQHGVPTYQDPVVTADGRVYTDARSLQRAERGAAAAAGDACHELIITAQLVPDGQAPAPPELVRAGVKSAQCLRANGLPNYRDPTANNLFTPGHGFSLDPGGLPGDKNDPTVRHALEACAPSLDDEARASSLSSLVP